MESLIFLIRNNFLIKNILLIVILHFIHLDNRPIFSVDIHPKGGRFATGGQGGQGGRIVIWNIAPVLSEADEDDTKVPKMLCQMDNHLGNYYLCFNTESSKCIVIC